MKAGRLAFALTLAVVAVVATALFGLTALAGYLTT